MEIHGGDSEKSSLNYKTGYSAKAHCMGIAVNYAATVHGRMYQNRRTLLKP